ncbi:MAG: EAL domain-containing protein [Lachnospiraceae bacterium]|nr:EAL domain-containing protein [Lachnospiraceae bacterium]
MIGKKRIIGICISAVHTGFKSDFVEMLNNEIVRENCKLIVFNSLLSVYDGSIYDSGASSVYNIINYDILDCLIIFDRGLVNKQTGSEIILKAKEKNVPVILINAEDDGCFCVSDDYKTSYRNLIRHVIRDHGVRDLFFMGGYRWDPDTLDRLACFKKALGDENINFDDSMVGYGEFKDITAYEEVERIIKERRKPPRAIICANDIMAMAVCRRLFKYGYRVPEDVIVTGYDGIEEGKYFLPNITTVRRNIEGEAVACASLIRDIFDGKAEKKIIKIPYKVIYNESCGCPSEEDFSDYRQRMADCMRINRDFSAHESDVFAGADKFLMGDSLPEMLDALVDYNLGDKSYLCIKSMLFESLNIMYKSNLELDFSNEYVILSSESEEEFGLMNDDLKLMVPDADEWFRDDTVFIVNALYVEDYQYGLYFYRTTDIGFMANRVNRMSRALNLSFGTVYTRMIQKGMQMELEQAAFLDPMTQISNLKGLEKWFDEFSSKSENHQISLAMAIFKLDRYRFIYENFGVAEIEEVVNLIASVFSRNNGRKKYVARISDDEFAVVDYNGDLDNAKTTENILTDEVNTLVSAVENYNSFKSKDYSIELNVGYTILKKGWNSDLRSMMRLAYGELYLCILRDKRKNYVQDTLAEDTKDHYDDLMLVLDKNLLTYYFQPIVDVATGEIYAYEALMRTAGGIDVSPLVLLQTAAKYKKLYELEKMTLFGIMDYYVEHFEKFKGRRLFINSIPGHFLNDADFKRFTEKYKDYIKYCVFEITEQNSISDGELFKIKTLTLDEMNGQLAVDDYGSGQSNIQNLLRYTPNIVKIDRFLIKDIYKDSNKQLFISNIIEFAKMNDMRVVGEGVETKEELKTVVQYGVDFIQGFYTAKPNPEPLEHLPESIQNDVENSKEE